jgi:hypothetical protein
VASTFVGQSVVVFAKNLTFPAWIQHVSVERSWLKTIDLIVVT